MVLHLVYGLIRDAASAALPARGSVWRDTVVGTPGQKEASRIADYTSGDVQNTDEHDAYIDSFRNAGDRLRKAMKVVDTI